MKSSSRFTLAVFIAVLSAAITIDATAQQIPVKVGLGFDAVLQSSDGLGIGFRTRISKPLNWDVSLALDLGLTGFVFEGRDQASYVFDPQVSVIVTFPDLNRATYFLGGFGIYAPFGSHSHSDSGPTIHLGVGRALPLRDSTFYYEIDPALIILSESVGVSIPFRVGIIL